MHVVFFFPKIRPRKKTDDEAIVFSFCRFIVLFKRKSAVAQKELMSGVQNVCERVIQKIEEGSGVHLVIVVFFEERHVDRSGVIVVFLGVEFIEERHVVFFCFKK